MPAGSQIYNAVQEFTDQKVESNEQHKDMFDARIKRVNKGCKFLD